MKTLNILKRLFNKTGSPFKIVFIFVIAGGLWILFSDIGIESLTSNPNHLYYLHTFKDWFFVAVTSILLYFMILSGLKQQKKKEAEIWEILEYFPMATVVVDVNDRIVHINKKFIDTIGYTIDEMPTSRDWYNLAYPDPEYQAYVKELWYKEVASIDQKRKEFGVPNLTIVDKFQNIHNIEFHVMPLEGRFIIVFNDITDQNRIEYALRESEYRYRRLFETAGDAIFILRNDKIIDCNLQTLKLFNCTKDEFLNNTPYFLSPQTQPDGRDSMEKALDIIQQVMNTDETLFFEWIHARPNGEQLYTEVTLNKIIVSNEVLIQAIVHDITDRKNTVKSMQYRIALEKLILDISTRFISLPSEEIDENIEIALKELCEFIGVDTGCLCLFNSDLTLLNMTHHWCNTSISVDKKLIQNIPVNPDNLRINKILNFQEVSIQYLDQVFDLTGIEKLLYECQGAKSLVKVPIIYKDKVAGILGISSVRQNREWDETEISILKMASQIFFNALLRKSNEEELHNRERNYREIFNSTNDAMIIYNIENNVVMDINNAFIDLFGYSEVEIVNAHLKDLITGKILSLTDHEIGLLRNLDTIPQIYEWQAQTKDGVHFWIEISIKKTYIDGKLYALAIIRNIQDRKVYEEALKESEKRYREIFENANEAIFVVQDGKMVFLNLKTSEILGYPRAELVSHGVDDFIHPDDKKMVMQRYTKRLDGEEIPSRYSIRLITRVNQIKWADINAVIISWNDKPATLVFMHDITEQIKAEEALKQNEERLNLALEGANDGLWDFNPQTGLAYFSPRWFTMLGYTPDSFPHTLETLFKLMHPEDMLVVKKSINQLKTKPQDYISFEFRLRTNDDQWMWIRSRAKTVEKNKDGNIIRMVGTHSDITKNKKNEEALREQSILLKSVIDNFPFELWARDNEGRCFLQNNYSIRTWGNLIDKFPEQQGIPPEILELWQENNRRAFAGEVIDEEVEAFDLAGNLNTFQNIIAPIKDGESMFGILGINIDITKRKKAEAALQDSQQRLTLIFNSVKDMILLAKVEDKGCFITIAANQSFLDEIGLTDENVEGLDILKVLPKNYSRILVKSFKNILSKKVAFSRKEENLGNKILEVTITPIYDDLGRNTLILAVMHDLSERKKKELALQIADRASRLASLGTLAAGISHEINQPLTALKIKVDSLLYWGEEKPELMKTNLEQNLQFISREADKIDAIIKHMRSLAQIDHVPPPERVDINKVIKNILSLIGQQLQSHRIKVILKLYEPELFVLAHETPMEQVIINLTINAMYALDDIESDNKTITLSTKLQDDKCIIEVEDNGPGISEQNLARIFDPFFTTKIGKEGMGLGLAIVQNILSSIGGSITAENVKTGGALFRITLGIK